MSFIPYNPRVVTDWQVFTERRRHKNYVRVPSTESAIRERIIPMAGGRSCSDQNMSFQHCFHTVNSVYAWQTVNYLLDIVVENTIRLEELCRNWQPVEESKLLSHVEADVKYLIKLESKSTEVNWVARCGPQSKEMNNPSGHRGSPVFQQGRHENYKRISSLDFAIQELIIPIGGESACTDQNMLFQHFFHADNHEDLGFALNYLTDLVVQNTIRLEELCRNWQPVEESPLLSQIAKDLAELKSHRKHKEDCRSQPLYKPESEM